MTAETLSIVVSGEAREFVEGQVAEGGYEDAGAYVEALIHADRERRARERLEELLLEGLDSGPATPMTQKDWSDLREEVRRSARGDAALLEEAAGTSIP